MAEPERPLAMICGASATGLGVGRDLGRHGIPVAFADYESFRPGFVSRFVRSRDECVTAHDAPQLVERLIEVAKRQPVRPVLFPTTDSLVLTVAEHREALEPFFRIAPGISEQQAAWIVDKRAFYKRCEEINIPIPRTAFPATANDVRREAACFQYPVILKPTHGHLWRERLRGRKLLVAENEAELNRHLQRFGDDLAGLMIQEMIPGKEENLWLGGIYRGSSPQASVCFVGRKLRQYPPGFGSASLAEAQANETVKDLSLRFVRSIDYRGVCGTEFKFDARDGIYKMVEVNPRQTLWFSLIAAAGLPLNHLAWCDLGEQPLPKIPEQQDGTRWLYFEKDLATATKYILQGRLSPAEYLRSLRGVKVRAVTASDDRRPLFRSTRVYLVRIFQRLAVRLGLRQPDQSQQAE